MPKTKKRYTTPGQIKKEEEKILREEKKIEQRESEIIALDTEVKNLVKKDIAEEKKEEAMVEKEQTSIQKIAVNHVKNHKYLLILIVFVAGGLAWKGLWGLLDSIPIFSYSIISLLTGLALLWLFNKLKDL